VFVSLYIFILLDIAITGRFSRYKGALEPQWEAWYIYIYVYMYIYIYVFVVS